MQAFEVKVYHLGYLVQDRKVLKTLTSWWLRHLCRDSGVENSGCVGLCK